MSTEKVKTPMLDKMSSVRSESQRIGEFMTWLEDEKEIHLCTRHTHDESCEDPKNPEIRICGLSSDEYSSAQVTIEKLLAEFFKIDLKQVEDERCALLDEIRKDHTT